jgi:hypothetical protein
MIGSAIDKICSRFQVSVSKVQRFWVQGFKGSGLDSTAFDRLRP